MPMPRRIDTLYPTRVEELSGMFVQIRIPDTPKQKSISELILELAEREANEIAQLKAKP